ncbi:MAG: 2-octaprenyl-6-methoxyphenyl hydroxylase [Steroidobacteraceae bacterium]|jgi:2-octaprenyl-6-methoxyphenol hydroxylase
MSARPEIGTDIAIVGGGLVGASLALALAGSRHRVALIESVRPGADEQPSFDERTTALGNGSRRVLQTLGAWAHMAPHAGLIRDIHISDAGRFGFARLNAKAQDLEAFGYVVPNRAIGAALWQRLAELPALETFMPVQVTAAEFSSGSARLELTSAEGVRTALRARLVIAADGAGSAVRTAAGIGAEAHSYGQVALVANVASDRPATGTAYERFTPTGPLAVLPLADGSYTIVWSLAPERAAQLLASEASAYLAELQRCFGWRIGRLTQLGRRVSYPLALTRAGALSAARCVLVGNAAQALHPVAGQGFNLGLRDAASLAEALCAAEDPGAPAVLETYEQGRSADRRSMIEFTDTLVRLFASQRPGIASARNAGLLLFDLLPPAKRALSQLSWGFGGSAGRLMRGLKVS